MTRMHAGELNTLISTSNVAGTNVYGRDGEEIGWVTAFMIEKRGGRVIYAILSVGGFLGRRETFHGLPWSKLDYDESLGGYRLDITREQLGQAPSFAASDALGGFSHEDERRFYAHYKVTPYWL